MSCLSFNSRYGSTEAYALRFHLRVYLSTRGSSAPVFFHNVSSAEKLDCIVCAVYPESRS